MRAEVRKDGEKWTLVLVRELPHAPAKVWQALTEPEHLREWAPFDADRSLGAVGTAQLSTVGAPAPLVSETQVKRADAPKLLEFNWGSKGIVIGFWIVTVLFCLQIGFTGYAQLRQPQVAEAFTHLGFPGYFRVELSWAKFLGVFVLLAPVPARLKEWAYAGFAITLVSALPEAWGWAAGTGVLLALSYFLWLRLEATPARA